MSAVQEILPGYRVSHADFGEGVVVASPAGGLVRVFFSTGERQVPLSGIRPLLSRSERILRNVEGSERRLRQVWLSQEAHSLPLMESASALTAAKIDILPHQVVLTHRVATALPRRFLVADEVGLGKTIETALILRELASRGELQRALIVVPAGLVNNWHRELNEVFSLDFEVFGSEGDVTDRKTNAFSKHDRLIASIDTLKRPARIRRLMEAPAWDLVVFDEAHHLNAYRNGKKITKTENFKLAEALKGHARDLLLLSATPHQGDHFRFWMLVHLLNPALFKGPEDMVENRHRLNSVIFRRTKADACRPDGSPLFARRWVHTESFLMGEAERRFYAELRHYLEDGFALAKRQGNEGRALGFVMAVFQKIAASSFAAVRRTLRRRMLMLTLHQAILRDQELDIDGREQLYAEARRLIHEEYGLGDDPISRSEVDRTLAELKLKLVRKLDAEALAETTSTDAGETSAAENEDLAASAVTFALPEERSRIQKLLACFPTGRETKVEMLLRALGALWRQNPNEKVVIFATYLGTVELLGGEIETLYPGQGVVVLKGGDHAAKLAAERRFRLKDGPRVLVCTAAGREGINLQFARILFNFDLPWNPMDVEQRIGRIHRYGQNHTAQVYNLVLSDTIEGRIFLLLNDKLLEIARALGKVDDRGNIAEDLRTQILGQLSERLSYERLYQEALSDPELRRTRVEVETALANASEARKVVFELFQDLEGFSLEDYQPFSDTSEPMQRLVQFFRLAAQERGWVLVQEDATTYTLQNRVGTVEKRFSTDRETALGREDLDLLGLDHALMQQLLRECQQLAPEQLGVAIQPQNTQHQGVLSWWIVEVRGSRGEARSLVLPLASDINGDRLPPLERARAQFVTSHTATPVLTFEERRRLLDQHFEPMLHRELQQRGLLANESGFSAQLIGWVEVVAGPQQAG